MDARFALSIICARAGKPIISKAPPPLAPDMEAPADATEKSAAKDAKGKVAFASCEYNMIVTLQLGRK